MRRYSLDKGINLQTPLRACLSPQPRSMTKRALTNRSGLKESVRLTEFAILRRTYNMYGVVDNVNVVDLTQVVVCSFMGRRDRGVDDHGVGRFLVGR